MVVVLENSGYPATLGSCSADPYLCSLAAQYASSTSWYAVSHPSLPNYLAMTTGSTQGCTTDKCKGPYAPSLAGQLITAGIPWVAWAESMPTTCALSNAGPYIKHHNPFVYESDANCPVNDLPYPGSSGAVSVLDGPSPPSFVWLTPNDVNNMHGKRSVAAGDAWLQANVGPILTSTWFTGGNATVIVTMDEYSSNNVNGGGQVPLVVISANAQGKGPVALAGNHYGLLGSIETAYGLPLLGAAALPGNGDLTPLFGSPPPPPPPTPTPTP